MRPASVPRVHHALSGALHILLADALFVPMGLLTAAFLTRQLGPEGYGRLSLATAVTVWLEWMILSAFSRATIKFIGEADDWRPVGTTALRVQLLSSAAGGLVLALLAGPIAAVLKEPRLVFYLRLFALDIAATALATVHRQILVGLGEFTQTAVAISARWVARLVLIVLLVELGLSVSGAILGIVGASLTEVVVARVYVRPTLFGRSTFPVGRLWEYAVPLFLFALSLRVFSNLDLFFVKILGGTTAQAGIYGAAQNLAMLPLFLVVAVSPLLLSTLGRALRDHGGRTPREICTSAMRAVIGLLPLVCIIAGAAPEIVVFIFGLRFLPVAPLLSVLIFGALARATITVSTTILISAGKPGWTSALSLPLVPLAIAGHLLLIPRFGPLGAAAVTTSLSGLGALVGFLAVHRLWGLLPPAATLLRSVLLSVPAYAAAVAWPTPGPALFVKLSALGLMVLLGFLILGEFSSAEIALARALLSWRALSEQKGNRV